MVWWIVGVDGVITLCVRRGRVYMGCEWRKAMPRDARKQWQPQSWTARAWGESDTEGPVKALH